LLASQPQELLARLLQRYPALLAVPLIVKAEVYGAITFYYRAPQTFSSEAERLAIALSDQAALAIENARLVAAAQEKAVLEERQRLARDLHDSVTQAVYSISLQAQAATRLLAAGNVQTTAVYLQELEEAAQEALAEMRLLIFELRPPVLEQAGLPVALQARLAVVEGRSSLTTRLIVEGVDRLPAPVEQGLYRIAQEALNNTLKHAHAGSLSVYLQQVQSRVILEITDDGVGFDPAIGGATGGLGLRGIAERVAQLRGQLTIESIPGAGTKLRVEIAL
jgi:signal transduction histidine kinase